MSKVRSIKLPDGRTIKVGYRVYCFNSLDSMGYEAGETYRINGILEKYGNYDEDMIVLKQADNFTIQKDERGLSYENWFKIIDDNTFDTNLAFNTINESENLKIDKEFILCFEPPLTKDRWQDLVNALTILDSEIKWSNSKKVSDYNPFNSEDAKQINWMSNMHWGFGDGPLLAWEDVTQNSGGIDEGFNCEDAADGLKEHHKTKKRLQVYDGWQFINGFNVDTESMFDTINESNGFDDTDFNWVGDSISNIEAPFVGLVTAVNPISAQIDYDLHIKITFVDEGRVIYDAKCNATNPTTFDKYNGSRRDTSYEHAVKLLKESYWIPIPIEESLFNN